MKQLIKILGLATALASASAWTHAGPVEALQEAFAQAQAEHASQLKPEASTQTVIRSYLATTNGLAVVSGSITNVGYLATKTEAKTAIANAGYTQVGSASNTEIYKAAASGNTTNGTILLVYYNAAGQVSEAYIFTDALAY